MASPNINDPDFDEPERFDTEIECFRRTAGRWNVANATGGTDWPPGASLARIQAAPRYVGFGGEMTASGDGPTCTAVDGIVGIELANTLRDRFRLQFFEDFLADGIVDFVQRREVEIGAGQLHKTDTIVGFKPLSQAEIDWYVASGEGMGKAGGYAIQGRAEGFVRYLAGSHSNVVGLPVFETLALLRTAGVPLG